MAIIRKAVEHEIGKRQPVHMLLVGGRLRKDETVGLDAAAREGGQQVGAGCNRGKAPEEAAGRAGEDLRPYLDHLVADLGDIVEGRKDEGALGKAMVGAAGITWAGAGNAVVGLVAFGRRQSFSS